jgi:hypothetical protein
VWRWILSNKLVGLLGAAIIEPEDVHQRTCRVTKSQKRVVCEGPHLNTTARAIPRGKPKLHARSVCGTN